MWKRIHSNRDPRNTLYRALRREFQPYFVRAGRGMRDMANRKPKWVFSIMVFLLALSAVLSFTLFREQEPKRALSRQDAAGLSRGFNMIIGTTANLQRTIMLKQAIDSLSAKGKLNHADSMTLNTALDSLAALQKSLNLQSHEH